MNIRFRDTCTRWPKIENAPNALNTHPWGPNFGTFRSTTSGFQDIAQFIISPLTTILNVPKKNKKVAKNANFEISLYNFGRDPP